MRVNLHDLYIQQYVYFVTEPHVYVLCALFHCIPRTDILHKKYMSIAEYCSESCMNTYCLR